MVHTHMNIHSTQYTHSTTVIMLIMLIILLLRGMAIECGETSFFLRFCPNPSGQEINFVREKVYLKKHWTEGNLQKLS